MITVSTVLWLAGLGLMVASFARLIFIFNNGQWSLRACVISAMILTAFVSYVVRNVPSVYIRPIGNGGWELHSSRHITYPVIFLAMVLLFTS
jgi:hypothetical protein